MAAAAAWNARSPSGYGMTNMPRRPQHLHLSSPPTSTTTIAHHRRPDYADTARIKAKGPSCLAAGVEPDRA
jgi:hypothetical protein